MRLVRAWMCVSKVLRSIGFFLALVGVIGRGLGRKAGFLRSAEATMKPHAVLLFLLPPPLAGSAPADILRVPLDFTTIQAAVDAAVPGDRVFRNILLLSGMHGQHVHQEPLQQERRVRLEGQRGREHLHEQQVPDQQRGRRLVRTRGAPL